MDLLKRATELHAQGFAVIPTRNKAPIEDGWTTGRQEPNGNFEQAGVNGVGVVLGGWHERGHLCLVDVDCYDKDISRQICAAIMDKLANTYPFRVGEAPKFGGPVLMTDKWRKAKSARFGKSHIELLGLGQQFVAYGDHPGAKDGQYQWYNGAFATWNLPVLQEADLWEIFDLFGELCLAAGMEKTADGTRERAQAMEEMDDLDLALANRPIDMGTGRVKEILKSYPPHDLDYDRWLAVGAALSHQYQGSDKGYKLWRKWSEQSDKHDPSQMRKKWISFKGSANPVTMASVVHWAKEVRKQAFTRPQGSYLYPSTGSALEGGTYINWVVEDIIEAATIGQIFASPGVGKTFLALDLAAHIAAGVDWNGRRVVGGPVVYLVGEGLAGIRRRMAAIEKAKGLDLSNLLMARMPNFSDADELNALLKEIDALPTMPAMIIMDTLARATVGLNENDSKDMGPIVEAMAVFTRKLGCVVMGIHHTPKGSSTEGRGSGAIKAAMDFEIRLEGDSERGVIVSCAKSKDAEAFGDMAFRLSPVKLPRNHTDNFNRRVSSAVVEWMDMEDIEPVINLQGNQLLVMEAFELVWADEANRVSTPEPVLLKNGIEGRAQGCYTDAVKEYFIRSHPKAGDMPPKRLTQSFNDAINGLVKKKLVDHFDSILVKN